MDAKQTDLPYIYNPDDLREICECLHIYNFKVFPSPQAVEERIHKSIRQFISHSEDPSDCGTVATGGYVISIFPPNKTGKYWVTFALHSCLFNKPRPLNDLWRIDVKGMPCEVKGEYVKTLIESIINENARLKMTLHKIKKEVLQTLGH